MANRLRTADHARLGMLLLCAVMGSATAEGRQVEAALDSRVLHFPKERFAGWVNLWPLPAESNLPVDTKRAVIANTFSGAEFVGLAQGDVTVPTRRGVVLRIDCRNEGSLACLSRLQADDLFILRIASAKSLSE
jgi:hypothetical protein